MVLVIVIGAIIAVALVWGFIFDRRHRGETLTAHNPRAAANRARSAAEEKGAARGGS